MLQMLIIIPKDQLQRGDRVRWFLRGNLNYGRVTRINNKTFSVDGEKDPGECYRVDKALVFEALRDGEQIPNPRADHRLVKLAEEIHHHQYD